MDLWTGIALLVAFLAVVILIIRGQSPIIMLLILAVLWAAIAGIGIDDIQKKVIQAGGVQYASAVIIIVFEGGSPRSSFKPGSRKALSARQSSLPGIGRWSLR